MKTKPKARTWVGWVGFEDGKPVLLASYARYDVFRTRTAANAVYEDVRRVVMTECGPTWRILIR